MKKYLDIKGKSIVNEMGDVKGIIDDCLVDYNDFKITSLVVTINNIFSFSNCRVIALKSIKCFGDNVVYQGQVSKINKEEHVNIKKNMMGALIGRDIIDNNGYKIGVFSDAILDEVSGKIKAIIASGGIIEDIVEGRRVIIVDEDVNIGKHKIIVNNNYINMYNEIILKRLLRG